MVGGAPTSRAQRRSAVGVDRVLDLVGGVADRVLHLSGGLVDAPLVLEALVVGQVTGGFLDLALGVVNSAISHGSLLCRQSPSGCGQTPYRSPTRCPACRKEPLAALRPRLRARRGPRPRLARASRRRGPPAERRSRPRAGRGLAPAWSAAGAGARDT